MTRGTSRVTYVSEHAFDTLFSNRFWVPILAPTAIACHVLCYRHLPDIVVNDTALRHASPMYDVGDYDPVPCPWESAFAFAVFHVWCCVFCFAVVMYYHAIQIIGWIAYLV